MTPVGIPSVVRWSFHKDELARAPAPPPQRRQSHTIKDGSGAREAGTSVSVSAGSQPAAAARMENAPLAPVRRPLTDSGHQECKILPDRHLLTPSAMDGRTLTLRRAKARAHRSHRQRSQRDSSLGYVPYPLIIRGGPYDFRTPQQQGHRDHGSSEKHISTVVRYPVREASTELTRVRTTEPRWQLPPASSEHHAHHQRRE